MSCHHIRFRRLAVFGLAVGALVVATVAVRAQSGNVKATVGIEAAGQPGMTMDYWLSDDSVRIDMAQPQAVSIIWKSGDGAGMLMIQHGERRYIEWGEQQLQMMRQMMQRMPGAGGGGGGADTDLESVRFEPTGETETIGPWSAAGVRVTGMEPGQEGTVWVAADLDSGLFELFARIGDALDAMQMPMMGGGDGPQQQLARFRQMKDAVGLPQGGVVRLNMNDQNGPTTITLESLDESGFAEDPFQPPAGYERMQMPSMPNMPG